ncbi:hypothetical protein BCR44DRAFT_1511660 [Catenaria anguillulae PL171]|uniref:Non-specific serine/threonine protein kinase n=1 Tax=Catenaria anguillulae PL171 TaxID=765915 RepID=A0A1Y2HSC2_9FUNG|nr:hypothetical protein BCR44DRAFT_1511660 [Catenaria anguillulae PL171]
MSPSPTSEKPVQDDPSAASNPPPDPMDVDQPTDAASTSSMSAPNIPVLDELIAPIRAAIEDGSPLDPTQALRDLESLREHTPVLVQADAGRFASLVVTTLLGVLQKTTPSFDVESPVHKLRLECLRLLLKANIMDQLEPYTDPLMQCVLNLLETDHDAVIRVVRQLYGELLRLAKAKCEPHLPAFVEYMLNQFLAVPATIEAIFDSPLPEGASSDNETEKPSDPVVASPRPSSATSSSLPSLSDSSSSHMPILTAANGQKLVRFSVLLEVLPMVLITLTNARGLPDGQLQRLLTAVVQSVLAQPKAQAEEQAQATANGSPKPFIGMSPTLRGREKHYNDLLAMQVKTLSFLAYVMRTQPMAAHGGELPRALFQVTCNLPPTALTTRREILQAYRHMSGTLFRSVLVNHIHLLLIEEAFTGGMSPVAEILRPLWIQPLAELVVAERTRLPLDTLERVMDIFMRGLHDPSISLQLHHGLHRALLACQEVIRDMAKESAAVVPQVERILMRVLQCITGKLVALNHRLKDFRSMSKVALAPTMKARPAPSNDTRSKLSSPPPQSSQSPKDPDAMDVDDVSSMGAEVEQDKQDGVDSASNGKPPGAAEESAERFEPDVLPDCITGVDMEASRPIKMRMFSGHLLNPSLTRELEVRTERDLTRAFLKALLINTRFILDALRMVSPSVTTIPPPAGVNNQLAISMSRFYRAHDQNEVEVFRELLRNAIDSLEYYWMDISSNNMGTGNDIIFSRMGPQSKEEKEIIDSFCLTYVHLDPTLFQEVVGSLLDYMFDVMVNDTSLLAFPQCLMGVEPTATRFLRMTLPSLLKRLPDLGGPDAFRSAVLFRVFKLAFSALGHFPESNAPVLRPFLLPLVTECMKLSATALDPMPYYSLLRSLFRSMFNSKAEILINDMVKLIPDVLLDLNRRLAEAPSHSVREVLVELIISFPLRLTDMLPYLEHLMRPLIMSLELGPELAVQGLRMIETVFESLTHEFLDPVLTPVYNDLMRALHRHLQPQVDGRIQAHAAMRILGRLGGRNRTRLTWSQDGVPQLDGRPVRIPIVAKAGGPPQFLPAMGPEFDLTETTVQALALLEDGSAEALALRPQVFKYLQFVVDQAELDVDERVFRGLFTCAALEIEEAAATLSDVTQRIRNHERVDRFLDAMVHGITSAAPAMRKLVQDTIVALFADVTATSAASEAASSAFRLLTFKFCSCCFRDGWYGQSGGLEGITTLVHLPVPPPWLMDLELDLIRALLYLLKSPESPREAPKVRESLHQLLKICNRPDTDPESERRFQGLIALLVSELTSSSAHTREAVQSALKLLADLRATDVTELLMPARDRLINPIFNKPLRSLPLAMQIGYTDAVTYCLSLRPPLLEFKEDLLRLIIETLALADAEDQSLEEKCMAAPNTPKAEQLIKLRVVCIQMLSAAMACNEFQSNRLLEKRNRITAIFFKSLYHKSVDVVDAGFKAMNQLLVVSNKKLAKEILQSGLRPILATLADPTRLTVEALKALGRLMELLSSYFKVELGQKLLEHLQVIAIANRLEYISGNALSDYPEYDLIMAILWVFPRLPTTAFTYLAPLVKSVLDMEQAMRRSKSSPFRKPLAAFLARYPTETFEHFAPLIESSPHALSLFIGAFNEEDGAPLRPAFIDHLDKFVPAGQPMSMAVVQVLCALHKLGGVNVLNDEVLSKLPALDCDQAHLFSTAHSDLVTVYLHYLEQPSTSLEAAERLSAYLHGAPQSYLRGLIQSRLHERAMVLKWSEVDSYLQRTLARKSPDCVMLLRHLIIPACQFNFIRNQSGSSAGGSTGGGAPGGGGAGSSGLGGGRIGNSSMEPAADCDAVVSPERLEQIKSLDLKALAPDELIIEVLQFLACLAQYVPSQLLTAWTDLIRSVWPLVTHEEITVKAAAHVVLANLSAAFEKIPPRVVTSTFVNLLKEYRPEVRSLVFQGLETLLPILPSRSTEGYASVVIPAVQRAFVDEAGGLLGGTIHMCTFIVANRELLYPLRKDLYPSIEMALNKLVAGLTSQATDPRIITLGLVRTVVEWEQRRRKSLKPATKRKADDMEVDVDLTADAETPKSLCDALITMIARLSLHVDPSPIQAPSRPFKMDGNGRPNLSHDQLLALKSLEDAVGSATHWPDKVPGTRTMSLMREFLELWPEHQLRLALIERALAQPTNPSQQQAFPIILRSIEMLAVDLEQPRPLERTAETFRLVSRVFQCDEVDWFAPALYPYFVALLKQADLEGATLTSIVATLQARLENQQHLPITIGVLDALARRDADVISPTILAHLCKIILRLSLAHFNVDERTVEGDICLSSVGQQPKRPHVPLCSRLVRGWTDSSAALPTPREMGQLLHAMMSFRRHENSGLMSDYLNLCASLMEKRGEVAGRLEPVYLFGLTMRDPETRAQFVKLVDESLPDTIMARLEYALGVQNWEQLADAYYIPQLIDLIIGALSLPKPVLLMFRLLPHVKNMNAHQLWTQLFVVLWGGLHPRERSVLQQFIVAWITRDYHHQQVQLMPNVVHTMLEAIPRCRPLPRLPPQVIKYLGKTFNAWHSAAEFLSLAQTSFGVSKDEERVRDLTLDGLAELLTELNETDLYIGLWRRRCQYPETNAALSYQQLGMWERAQHLYEQAQSKGRTGTLGFQESEFMLWEEQWIRCAQKLQQWDILESISNNENRKDLALESAWRLGDWTTGENKQMLEDMIASAPDSARTKVFKAFIALIKLSERKELDDQTRRAEFQSICDEGAQMALSMWHQYPRAVTESHIPLLALFQQFVELSEALTLYHSLSGTQLENYTEKANEQKPQLTTWRDRLPNRWDDIDVWSDLVAWRQHIFGAINKAFYPIHTALATNNGPPASASAYRGYHETAWIINRFANVARLHGLTTVCIQYLPKIYALPNIEIHEAFLKLREQAKCYLQNPDEYRNGLDIINHTNLVYFNSQQKAEFYSLRGRFLARLGLFRDADMAFAQAVRADSNIAKVWATWGEQMERHMVKAQADGVESNYDKEALSCYLTTIGHSKCGRARQYVAKVLWLLANQKKDSMLLSETLETHKNDLALWYWLPFIPQLLNMLVDPNQTRHARFILTKLAKSFPQALHFSLRTLKEEVHLKDEQQVAAANDIMTVLKTSAPLLALSMETMVDQLIGRLKPLPQEDIYRLVVVCLNEMVEHMCTLVASPSSNGSSSPTAASMPVKSLQKLSEQFTASASLRQYYDQFKRDFIDGPPEPMVIVDRFRIWRDDLQRELDEYRVPEHLPHYLIEFEHQRFDEVDIPGQYQQLVDSHQHFIKINRFCPEIERVRMDGNSHRRIRIVGHDGSIHSFLVQQPAPSMCRREERVLQLVSFFNSLLDNATQARKRSIQFHYPTIAPLAPNVRMISHDPSSVSLEQVWAAHCKKMGVPSDHAIMLYMTQLQDRQQADTATKIELLEEIRRQFAPADLLETYIMDHVGSFTDLWMLRKQFTMQLATTCFLSFALSISLRYPQSLHFSLKSGNLWMSEALMSIVDFRYCHFESVPFRLTPTLQHMITAHGLDGPFTACVMATAKALTVDGSHKSVVQDVLRVVVRDDLMHWAQRIQQPFATDSAARKVVDDNVDEILKRMSTLVEDCAQQASTAVTTATAGNERPKVDPANRHLLELVNRATNPQNLADMNITWMPFL